MWSPTHVQVVVQRARNVIAKGKNGTNDSYVVIQNGKEKFQTSVKEQSVDPVWHEECDLLIDDKENDVIKLIIFHRNLFGLADEFLGQAFVPLKDLDIYERPKSRWYELEGRTLKSSKKYRGEIEIRVTFIVKNIPNEKLQKKRHSLVHHSLLDLRGGHKNEPKADKHEPKHNISGRKFSMADGLQKVPKMATRSISFKLESFNNRRKSLVDKFLKRRDSSLESDRQNSFEEDSLESENVSIRTNGVIDEELTQSQEEVRQLGKKCENKIVIQVKNEINAEETNIVENESENKKEDNLRLNEMKNICENNNESQIVKVLDSKTSKSSAWKPFKGSLKRAFSTSNLVNSGNANAKPVPKITRERSSTTTTLTSASVNTPSPEKLSPFHGPKEKINGDKSHSAFLNNEAIFRRNHSREKLLSALKKSERRHTIDFDDILPNLKHPSIVSEKRATQASPDSLYSSFESLIHRRQPKTDYHQKYDGLNKEELIQLIENQQLTILGLNEQINDLEQYIDNLLVRVIETSPRLLQNSHRTRLESLYKI